MTDLTSTFDFIVKVLTILSAVATAWIGWQQAKLRSSQKEGEVQRNEIHADVKELKTTTNDLKDNTNGLAKKLQEAAFIAGGKEEHDNPSPAPHDRRKGDNNVL